MLIQIIQRCSWRSHGLGEPKLIELHQYIIHSSIHTVLFMHIAYYIHVLFVLCIIFKHKVGVNTVRVVVNPPPWFAFFFGAFFRSGLRLAFKNLYPVAASVVMVS